MKVFYLFAAVSLWLGVLSLLSGRRFSRYVRQQLDLPLSNYTPRVSVIAPCRGIDQGFEQNINALLQQNYPHYDILFVVDSAADPALKHLEKLQALRHGQLSVLVAGPAKTSGQKVHNLIIATQQLSHSTDVIVFVDSDARPSVDWLRTLVSPLEDPQLGATTGYRWFVPVRGGFISHVRAVWNASIASALGANSARNFCWGGSTAMRRETFQELGITQQWSGSVSDDFTITRVLQQAQRPIHFVPACLIPSFEDCTFRELLTFSNRQVQITRVYAAHLWKQLLLGSAIFNVSFVGGIVLALLAFVDIQSRYLAAFAVLLMFILGTAKSVVRFRAVTAALEHQSFGQSGSLLAHALLWPVTSLLQFMNCVVAGLSRRIVWRGITYELKSPTEAVIISRES